MFQEVEGRDRVEASRRRTGWVPGPRSPAEVRGRERRRCRRCRRRAALRGGRGCAGRAPQPRSRWRVLIGLVWTGQSVASARQAVAQAAGTMRRMARLPLAPVTLCAVDTRCPSLAMQSLERSMAQVDFGRVVLFTHGWQPAKPAAGYRGRRHRADRLGCRVFVHRVAPPAGAHRTSHVLVTQWDGFVLDAGAWTDDFLAYDYVGAVWPECRRR